MYHLPSLYLACIPYVKKKGAQTINAEVKENHTNEAEHHCQLVVFFLSPHAYGSPLRHRITTVPVHQKPCLSVVKGEDLCFGLCNMVPSFPEEHGGTVIQWRI